MKKPMQSRNHYVSLASLFVAMVVTSLLALSTAAQAEERSPRIPEAVFTDGGADGCVRCHAGENIATIRETAHGDADNPHTPFAQAGCESCHGPGSLHESRARGGAGFPSLAQFGRGGDPVEKQLAACLDCHAKDMGELRAMEWKGSLHDTGRMICSTCHQLHAKENVLAQRDDQIARCATCHGQQIQNHNRFEGRGIVFDRLSCDDCHDVHQLIRK